MRSKKCIICWSPHQNTMSKCCSPKCERTHRANLNKANKEKEKLKKEKVRVKKAMSRSSLIKEADRVSSIYIRERDRGKPCITCWVEWNENHQNWHFASRRHLNTRWLDKNQHSQCPKCNCWGAGEQYLYSLAIDRLYGPWTASQIMRLAQSIEKTTDEEIICNIKLLYKNLDEMCIDYKPKKIILNLFKNGH